MGSIASAQDLPAVAQPDKTTAQTPIDDSNRLPQWVTQGSFTEGSTEVLVVQTRQPFTTMLTADAAIDGAIQTEVARYLNTLFGMNSISPPLPDLLEVSKRVVPGTRIVRTYQETFSPELAKRYGQAGGTFYRGYAQIRLDDHFRQLATTELKKRTTGRRLKIAGLVGTGMLGWLAVLFGYLKAEQVSRGFYSRRLQMISALTAIAIGIAIVLAFFIWV